MNAKAVYVLCVLSLLSIFASNLALAIVYQQSSQIITQTILRRWLNGWDKRIKITIDHNDVASNLSNFPVLIHLSNASGRNTDDVSFIFNELQSGANRKKIAVTTSDAKTQLYVEIERWDSGEAWLWAKVPSISNTRETVLYLYYDKDHADNTEYVGDPQSTPAQSVWSPNFSAVLHFNNDFRDSSDGDAPSNSPTATFVAGKMANGGEFYDNGDEADYTTAAALGGTGASDDDVGTVSFWMKGNEASYDYQVDVGYINGIIAANYQTTASNTTNKYLMTYWGGWRTGSQRYVTLNLWHYVVVSWNASRGFRMLVDGASYNAYSGAKSMVVSLVTIGNYNGHGAYEANAIIDEVRFVNDAEVSDAWIKASYESERDHLLDFADEETF